MGKRKGKDRTGGRNADGSVSQGVEVGDPRERKLRELAAGVVWDGDRRGPGALALAVEDLVPEQRGFVVVIRNFFTPKECQQWRAIVEQVGLNPASAADLWPRKNEAFLNRESLACPCEVLYDKLYSRLEPLAVPVAGRRICGLTPRVRYYKYSRGHRFDAHVDVSSKGEMPGWETEYTLLLYLNGKGGAEGLVGGDTIFYATKKRELCRVAPEEGMVLLHAHGQRCLLHAGDLVTRGAKYMLRCDVMYRPDT